MSNSKRQYILKIILLFFMFGLIIFAFQRLLWSVKINSYYELVIFSGIYFALFILKPFRNYLSSLPKSYKIIYGFVFFLLIFSQHATRSHLTFPFVQWGMYTHTVNEDRINLIKFFGVTANGNEELLHIWDTFPSLKKRVEVNLRSKIKTIQKVEESMKNNPSKDEKEKELKGLINLIRKPFLDIPYDVEEEREKVDELLRVVGAKLNQEKNNDPYTKILVKRGVVLKENYPDIKIDYETIWKTDLTKDIK